MQTLIADNESSCRDFVHGFFTRNRDTKISAIAVDAEASSKFVVPWQLRKILDNCPICKGGFRDHAYSLLATVAMNEEPGSMTRLSQLLRCMRESRWREVPAYRQWVRDADAILAFAFRCHRGRVGIVTVFSPADSEAPDQPLQFTILSMKEGKELLTAAQGVWIHVHNVIT